MDYKKYPLYSPSLFRPQYLPFVENYSNSLSQKISCLTDYSDNLEPLTDIIEFIIENAQQVFKVCFFLGQVFVWFTVKLVFKFFFKIVSKFYYLPAGFKVLIFTVACNLFSFLMGKLSRTYSKDDL